LKTVERLSKVVGLEGTSTRAEDEDQLIENMMKEEGTSDSQEVSMASCTILVLNKIDRVFNRRRLEALLDELEGLARFEKVFYTSAETLYGVRDLQAYLLKGVPRGEWEVNPGKKTEMSEMEQLEETIKECVYSRLYYEVPHWTSINLEDVVIQPDKTVRLAVRLEVDSTSKRGIVVGPSGKNLRVLKEHAGVLLAKKYNAIFAVSFRVVVVSKNKETVPDVGVWGPQHGERTEWEGIERLYKQTGRGDRAKKLGEKWYMKNISEK
jgi:GTP-binding protein Era